MRKIHIIIALTLFNVCVSNAQNREFMQIDYQIYPTSVIDSIVYSYTTDYDSTVVLMANVFTKEKQESDNYRFRFSDISFISPDTVSEHIDLGLSVEWATKDFMASNFGEEGQYYFFINDNIEGTSDDPVTKKMGYPWRMPVKEEVEELKWLVKYAMPKPYNTLYLYGKGNILVLNGMTSWSDKDKPYWQGDSQYKSVRIRPVYAPTPVEKINLTTDTAVCSFNNCITVYYTYNKVPAIQSEGIELRYPEFTHLDGKYSNGATVISGTTVYYRPYLLVGGQYVYGEEKSIETFGKMEMSEYIRLLSDIYSADISLIKANPINGKYYLPSQKAWEKFLSDHEGKFSVSQISKMDDDMKGYMFRSWYLYVKGLGAEQIAQIVSTSRLVSTSDGYNINVIDEIPDDFVNSFVGETTTLRFSKKIGVKTGNKSSSHGVYYTYTLSSESSGRISFTGGVNVAGKYRLVMNLGPCPSDNDRIRVSGYINYTTASGKMKSIDLENTDENAVDENGESMYGTKYIDLKYKSTNGPTEVILAEEIDIESVSAGDNTNFHIILKNMKDTEGYSKQLSVYSIALIPITGNKE